MILKLQNLPTPNIINLTECKDRRKWTEDQWKILGVDNIRVHTYDRYEDGKSIEFIGDQKLIAETTKGVTSSHLLTIKWWLDNTTEEYGLFFEDDVDYKTVEHWNFTLEEYIERCSDYQWGCLHMCNVFEYPYDYLNEYIPMVPRKRMLWDHGLQAYALTREYAQQIVDYYFGADAEKIHYRMPNDSPVTTENNVMEGFGLVITFPLFNHNVTDFRSKNIYYYNKQASSAFYSYEFLKDWWESKGSKMSLNEIFDDKRESHKTYGELKL